MKSTNTYTFDQTARANIPRSQFNLSHGYKTTMNGLQLVPMLCEEIYPGDEFNVNTAMFARLSTPLHPYMDNLWIQTFYFFCPTRLVWDNFQKFMGEQIDPGDSTDYLIPQVTAPLIGWSYGSYGDYFALPLGNPSQQTSAIPLRMLNLIWNDWFRDQNLQDSLPVPKDDGPDPVVGNYENLPPINKQHDYFSSCLPWPQKGPAVTIPLGTSAPVVTNNQVIQIRGVTDNTDRNMVVNNTIGLTNSGGALASQNVKYGTQTGLEVDLNDSTAATINSLRQAFQLQKLYERDARGGTRYTEIIRSHFGVVSPDARLQRPEYLGGGRVNVNVTPIAQTSETTESSPQGNLAAFATASTSGMGFTKSFTEHGYVIALMACRADLNYQQNIDRHWSRRTKEEMYWPALSHIGEQAVLNKEIFSDGSSADDEVFGYNERYAELRYRPSKITGKFRSSETDSLDSWHLAQEFADTPTLNDFFVISNPPLSRILAVPSQPAFIVDMYHSIKASRPLPTYGTPGLIDHF